MTVDELHAKMEAEFRAVDGEFKAIDSRFKAIDSQFKAVDGQFKAVREEFKAVRTDIKSLDQHITTEGVNTRQHFDVVAEHFKEYTKALADGIGRNTERLDEHDKRITILERRGS